MSEEKWKSPTGAAISSHETDKVSLEKLELPNEITIYQTNISGVGKLNTFSKPLHGEYIERRYIAVDHSITEK